jgi:predicted AlkP superfamily phosphohydrolase/phosphomutase
MIESRARFAAIDMTRTQVFSDELNYFPALHLNLVGREPQGIVPASAVDATCARIEDTLRAIRDPWTGRPVVEAIHRREAIYAGPLCARAPDLVLTLALDDGYTYNLMPSAGAPPGGAIFRRLAADELLARKGRSLAGSHRPHGIYVAHGPGIHSGVEVPAAIADATATLLARMAIAVPPEASGRVLWSILRNTGSTERRAHPTLPRSPVEAPPRRSNEERVEQRLRALGYVE